MPQTTITEFIHADTSSKVTLVGNHHFATIPYMQTIRSRLQLADDSGAKIHYEGLTTLPLGQENELPKDIRRKYIAIDNMLKASRLMSLKKGLVSLGIAVPHLRHWENHDTSIVDLATRATGFEGLILRLINVALEPYNGVQKASQLTFEAPKRKKHVSDEPGDPITKELMDGIEPLIVDYRNDIALRAVDDAIHQTPTQNLALLWGEGHVPGLTDGLIQRGYQPVNIEYLDPAE